MEKLKYICLFIFALFLSVSSYSQNEDSKTKLEKNIDYRGVELEQNLNKTLDTLTLRHPVNIYRVTVSSHDIKESFVIDVGNPEVKIPLYLLKKGRYTIAVNTPEKMIVLSAERLYDIPPPEGAIADLEEAILRSSLSEEEQLNRNMKPLKKQVDTRVAKVESKAKTKRKINKISKPKRTIKKRVAKVKPKRKVTKRTVRKPKKRPDPNKKSRFALLAEKKALSAKKKKVFKPIERKVKGEKVVASKDEKEKGTILKVTKVTYNLSQRNSKSIVKQSRKDYRANNLRPNGKPYQN